jgi:Fe-S cluster biogenesis protein NfuA
MPNILTLFKRKTVEEPVEMGPLYPAVKTAMDDVQAYARSHGGHIDLLGVSDEGEVKIRLRGTCRGCPMSSITIRLGIEEKLRILVPGVKKVTQIDA